MLQLATATGVAYSAWSSYRLGIAKWATGSLLGLSVAAAVFFFYNIAAGGNPPKEVKEDDVVVKQEEQDDKED